MGGHVAKNCNLEQKPLPTRYEDDSGDEDDVEELNDDVPFDADKRMEARMEDEVDEDNFVEVILGQTVTKGKTKSAYAKESIAKVLSGWTDSTLETLQVVDLVSDSDDSDDEAPKIAPTAKAVAAKKKEAVRAACKEHLPYFNESHSGQQVPRKEEADRSPLGFFLLLFTSALSVLFCNATNSFAHSQPNSKDWIDLEPAEFANFLGIILYMGVVKLPQRGMYWSDRFVGQVYVKGIMTRNRFDAIVKNWHIVDTSVFTVPECKQKSGENCFWSVQPLVDELKINFIKYYKMYQCVGIDEMCIPWKGRHRAKLYNPNKPEKWHFKVFALNCAITGYLYTFNLYQGKDSNTLPGLSGTEDPVMRLMTEDPAMANKDQVVFLDNWYTGYNLCLLLMAIGIHVVGTFRLNRTGPPKEAKFEKAGKNKKDIGVMKMMEKEVKYDDNDDYDHTPSPFTLYFMAWMDSKPVHLMSTLMSYCTSTVRNTVVNSVHNYADLNIPSLIVLYNMYMGGTDRFDQLMSYYRTKLRTRKWQPRIFAHLIRCCVVNAHILYKQYHNIEPGSEYDHLLPFFMDVIEGLVGMRPPIQTTMDSKTRPRTLDAWIKSNIRFTGNHVPGYVFRGYLAEKAKGNAKRAPDGRKPCMLCKHRQVSSFCVTCGVSLCLSTSHDPSVGSCWVDFHTLSDPTIYLKKNHPSSNSSQQSPMANV